MEASEATKSHSLGSYAFSLVLIASIVLGGLTGYFCKQITPWLKPIGDLFLNLIFTTIVPLIFFSISSAIARSSSLKKLGRILYAMVLVFLFTGIIAAIFAISVTLLFTPVQNISIISDGSAKPLPTINMSNQLAEVFTVSDFSKLLSHEHILALIVFSILVGVAVIHSREKGKEFSSLLKSGEEVFMNVFNIIMYIAPLGFFSYFAVLVNELGPKLMENYVRVAILYYSSAIIYFIVILSFYAYLAGRMKGIKLFWKNILIPMLTSIATCSSAASIPANLSATKAIGISPEIYETTIPIGSLIHKDGSVMGGVFKIAFLFAMFQLPFSTLPILFTALGVSLLVGSVMGAIPSGGMLGELLILAVYGFPPSVLIAAAAISIIIDPIATMLNVTSNTVSTMMVAHIVEGKIDTQTHC